MIIPLSAILLLFGVEQSMSIPVSPRLSVVNTGVGRLSGDFESKPFLVSDAVNLDKRVLPVPIPLPEIYHVKNSDAILRLGFGSGTPIPIRHIFPLLLVCAHDVAEKIAWFGANGEIEWETGHRQIYARDLGDGVRLTIMNLVGHEILWGELRSVIKGLQEFLVDGRRNREVVFRFRFGAGPEVGWGFVAKGSSGGNIPRPPHGLGQAEYLDGSD
ncbi:MAG: hypothetical protein Q9209_004226 [Squamulea sp. 1 TL-2023]